MKGLVSLIILQVSLASFAYAQPFTDLASLNYHYHFPKEYIVPQDLEKRNVHYKNAEVLFPLKIEEETYLLIGGQYSKLDLGFFQDLWFNQDFSITDFKAGILFPWQGHRHKTLLLAITRWSGEGNDLFVNSNFQKGAIGLHSYEINERLTLKAGLYYMHEFFGHYFVPLGGIDWRIKDDLWLYGTLPAHLQLHKQYSPSFALSVSYVSLGGTTKFSDREHHIRIGQGFPPYGILGADAHWTFWKPATIKLSIGHSLARNYGRYDEDLIKEDTGQYADYRDGLVFRASLIARVFTGENEE